MNRFLGRSTRCGIVLVVALVLASCGGNKGDDIGLVGDIKDAVAAVEDERGEPQEYFEVTANHQLTNVFVAVEGATAAIPYVYLDGELQAPGPLLEGASGHTFLADDIVFDPDVVFDSVSEQLPEAEIDAFSIEGGETGSVRYVISVRSEQGGALDVTVAADGTVLAVDPI
jgi:hypothetical protein